MISRVHRRQHGLRRTGPLGAALFLVTGSLAAQQPTPPARDTTRLLPEITVTAKRVDTLAVPALQRLTLPTTASITAQRAKETVNLIDTQDAVKYLPSLFIRKRNYGDTQATVGTRVWGVSSSARSLVFADGVPLTALIANNNTLGAPRWGLVSPEEIQRIDVMLGPFSAAYAGNSMGAVIELTTRQPDRFEGSISQTQAVQHFNLYGTKDNYVTSQTGLHVGDRFGKFSFWLSGNYQNSNSQPLTYVTGATFPANTTGGFAAQNKLGAPANVLGASGLLKTDMVNARIKLAYDLSPVVRAAYSFGYWYNGANSFVDTYIDSAGAPTFARQAGFASGYYNLRQSHMSHSVSLRTDTRKDWDFEAVGTLYRFGTDRQRLPTGATGTDTAFSTAGRVALLDGTGWATLDLKGAWHAGGLGAAHVVTFGVHGDQYTLRNPTFNVPDWRVGDSSTSTSLATRGDGKTRTFGVWAQDRWRLAPTLSLTVGGRVESWRAYDGVNVNGATTVNQPTVSATKFSPKGVLAWAPTPNWVITASAAKAYRFATATELYQLVSTGTTFTSPDPNLKPDDDFATELRIERQFARARAQIAFFRDDVHDAIISQFLPLVPNSPTLFSYVSNVDHVRGQGVELTLGTTGFVIPRLDLSATGTYLDSEILALSGRASATAPAGSAIGKQLPNIPKWRASATATYHAGDHVALSLGGRYSAKMYTTLDNADVNPNTYQGFTSWFVMDARVTVQAMRGLEVALGVDNLNDRKYFLFHPFPQRTFIGSMRYTL